LAVLNGLDARVEQRDYLVVGFRCGFFAIVVGFFAFVVGFPQVDWVRSTGLRQI